MLHGSFILADDYDALIKLLIFGAIGLIWVIKQVASAASSTKKPANGPRPTAARPRPGAGLPPPPMQPPSAMTLGRPGGPATTLQDARRLAQARALQARAAQARAAEAARLATLAATPQPRPAPSRPAPSRPAPPRVTPTPPAPAAPVVRTPAPASPAVRRAAPAIVAGKPRAAVRPLLTAQSLRSQYILTEILAPPVSMRQDPSR